MKTPTSLVHERIDDVPLLIGLAQKLRLPEANYSPQLCSRLMPQPASTGLIRIRSNLYKYSAN